MLLRGLLVSSRIRHSRPFSGCVLFPCEQLPPQSPSSTSAAGGSASARKSKPPLQSIAIRVAESLWHARQPYEIRVHRRAGSFPPQDAPTRSRRRRENRLSKSIG